MYNSYDRMFKSTTDHFFCIHNQKFCDGKIINNEIITDPPIHRIMDIIYKLEDEYHNFEFQTGKLKTKDLIRFNLYQSMIMDKYKTEKVKTTIIYTEKINKNTIKKLEQSRYDMNIISLKDNDGDIILNNIKSKIKNNEKISQKDECHLAFLPLYETKRDSKDILYEVCSLTNQILQISQENVDHIKKTQLMIVEILIKDEKEKEKYLEAIRMGTHIIDMILEEGRQEGREEGLVEGIGLGKKVGVKDTKIDITRKMLKRDISISEIVEITGLSKEEIESIH